MRPSDLQHKELQRVTMIELQAKVAELEDKNESLTSQNSELIKKTYGLELEKQELADEVLWVKTINLNQNVFFIIYIFEIYKSRSI